MTSVASRLALLLAAAAAVQAAPAPAPQSANHLQSRAGIYVPFYGKSPNGFSSASRGFNTFGLQAGSDKMKHNAGWDFNDYHFRQQCDNLQPQDGFDTYCSIDSGWSLGCNGDSDGLIDVDTNVIPDIKGLADHLHSKNLKLGIYIVPGGFSADSDKTIPGTQTKIGDAFSKTDPDFLCRKNWDYSNPDVQKWHDAQIKKFMGWGVDFIKLDYVTPGSPDNGGTLPDDTSGCVAAYHKAIQNNNASIRLDISWKLVRDDTHWPIWQSSADSLRVDQDINNGGKDTMTSWNTVLRTLDFYRQFINEQTKRADNKGIAIRPDMDNLYVGNAQDISGLTDQQRYTQAIHWIGAGANLITGSDLTHLDDLGKKLLFDGSVNKAAQFCANYPMQPRNPNGWGTVGGTDAMQLQAWVAGPDQNGNAVVVLANYGPDPGSPSTYNLNWGGTHLVSIGLGDLGLDNVKYNVDRVLGGGGQGGNDGAQYQITDKVESNLGPGESVLYMLSKA